MGQIIAGRLLNVGLRDLLFSGSLILQPRLKPLILQWIARHPNAADAKENPAMRTYTTQLYRLVVLE
ncbi:hypothetical protein MXD63_45450, partial [Frankia sp. Cpl3]|nr:hypothetical protein [Frankia sp. Cpl3]